MMINETGLGDSRGLSAVAVQAPSDPIPVVCGIVWTGDGRIVISKRADDQPMPSVWQFPGGKVEEGESLVLAMERELLEELGIYVHVFGLAHHEVVTLSHGVFELYYLHCLLYHGEPKPLTETAEVKVVYLPALIDHLITPGDKNVAHLLNHVGLVYLEFPGASPAGCAVPVEEIHEHNQESV